MLPFRGEKRIRSEVKLLSGVRLFATPLTMAYQVSPSMGFSRQEYSSGLPFPSPGELPDPGIDLSHQYLLNFNLYIYGTL